MNSNWGYKLKCYFLPGRIAVYYGNFKTIGATAGRRPGHRGRVEIDIAGESHRDNHLVEVGDIGGIDTYLDSTVGQDTQAVGPEGVGQSGDETRPAAQEGVIVSRDQHQVDIVNSRHRINVVRALYRGRVAIAEVPDPLDAVDFHPALELNRQRGKTPG